MQRAQERTAWVVDYADAKGVRRLNTFKLKKEADNFAATTYVREGTHVAGSACATVKQAGAFWIASAEAARLERTTIDSYRSHVDLHIVPFIGGLKLSALNISAVRAFEDQFAEWRPLACDGSENYGEPGLLARRRSGEGADRPQCGARYSRPTKGGRAQAGEASEVNPL